MSWDTPVLLHFNGTNGSTTYPNANPAGPTFTGTGGGSIDTGISKLGGGSFYANGANGVTADSDIVLDGPFCIQVWASMDILHGGFIFSIGDPAVTTKNSLGLRAAAGPLRLHLNDGGADVWKIDSGSTNYPSNTFCELAVIRDETGTMSICLNGKRVSAFWNFKGTFAGKLVVNGRINGGSYADSYWAPYIDELRVTRGGPRYSAFPYPLATREFTVDQGEDEEENYYLDLMARLRASASTDVSGDRAETSAGTDAQDRSVPVTGDRAETAAGTDAQDRSVPVTSGTSESAAGATAQDDTIAVTKGTSESSAGTDAQDRSVPVAGDRAETATGSDAQDRAVSITGPATESSAGTETGDLAVALPGAAAESSAGTTAQDDTISVPGPAAESAAGTTAQAATVTVPGTVAAVAETSAGTTAQDQTGGNTSGTAESSDSSDAQDFSVAGITFGAAESSAGTDAQDRAVPLAGAAAESSAGTTAQDGAAAFSGAVAESSAGTTAQDGTVTIPGTVAAAAESSAGTDSEDRTVAIPGAIAAIAETSAGTTAQDQENDDTYDVEELSTGDTNQDRVLSAISGTVAESSVGTTAQGCVVQPPGGAAQSGVRRVVQSYYEDYFARKRRKKLLEEEVAAAIEQTPFERPTELLDQPVAPPVVEKHPETTIAHVAEPKIDAIVERAAARARIISRIRTQGGQVEAHVLEVQRAREQAERDDEEDLLLLSVH